MTGLDQLDALVRHTAARPDQDFFVVDGAHATYRQFSERVAALVGGLRARGIGPGDRVGVAVYHGAHAAELHLAVQAAGAQPVLLSFGLAPVLPRLVRDLGLKLLVLGPRLDPEGFDGVEAVAAGDPSLAGAADWDWVRGRHPDTVSAIQFTAGSTGTPKAIVRTVGTDAADAWHRGWAYALADGDRWVSASPLNLSVLAGALRAVLLYGGTVLQLSHFDVEALDAATADGVHVLPLQAPQWRAVVAAGLADKLADRGLRTAVVTGQLMQPRALRELTGALGPRAEAVMNYGTSETGTLALVRSRSPEFGRAFHVGTPLPGNDLRVLRRADGAPAAPGELGEVVVRGPATTPGYLHEFTDDPAAPLLRVPPRTTAFHTGDVGRPDGRGGLDLLGRWSDAVTVAGRAVLPVEVEERLRALPGVADALLTTDGATASVLLEPDPDRPPPGDPQVRAVLADLVGGADVRHVPALPRTAAGKPDRTAARALAAHAGGTTP